MDASESSYNKNGQVIKEYKRIISVYYKTYF